MTHEILLTEEGGKRRKLDVMSVNCERQIVMQYMSLIWLVIISDQLYYV